MKAQARPTVAVIGGGFSGLMTTLHLLHDPHGPRVRLIERSPAFARGPAYAHRSADHLLNVRAANMSAFPDRPSHFIAWLAARGDADAGAAFVSRGRYGAYLQALLREATAGEACRLMLEADAAVGLEPEGRGWRVALAMGRTLAADAVVLAVGNLPPHAAPGLEPDAERAPAYIADPWSDRLAELPEQGLAVLVGAGLTMVDVALRLERERPQLRLLALSRRGAAPRRHLGVGPPPSPWTPHAGRTVRGVLGEVRARARHEDWRAVIDGLRPQVQTLWRGWSLAERRRFLRHLRPWWDVHRHRIAPEAARRLDHLTGSGALKLHAGRIRRIQVAGDGLEVAWSPRGETQTRRERAVVVVNCTGPNGDLTRSDDPLLRDMARRALVRADACNLGLDVDAGGRLVGEGGAAHPTLFAVGPVTRGAYWEITSVPDIRVQAEACAHALVAVLSPQPLGAARGAFRSPARRPTRAKGSAA